jgi:polysaccharide pyruvyl transferase WcaK-like protein
MPYHLILWGAAARIAGTPFAFVSIGAGPIVHPVSRFLMVSAARISKFRSFRDEASKRFLAKRRAANEGDFVTPDLAFGLPVPNFAGDPDSGEKKDTGPLIGIGVMSYFGWEQRQADGHEVYQQYITKLTEFCTWLLNSGFRLRLLVGGRSDAAVIEDLLGRLKQRTGETLAGRVIAEPAQSLTELVAQMSAAELIIATRYHNVVCALISGKPVISIGYADKNDFLLQKANLGAFAQKVDTLDVELLKRQFLELYSSKSNYISNISKMIDDFKSQLEGQQVRIFNFINNS